MANYNNMLYIGRFQPFHNGHLAIVTSALKEADRLIICIGSDDVIMSLKNPFSSSERMGMIRDSLPYGLADRVHFGFLKDAPGDNAWWMEQVRTAVDRHKLPGTVAITGMKKDDSSVYLDWFPDWPYVPGPVIPGLNATTIREYYFGGVPDSVWGHSVPEGTREYLKSFALTERYRYFKILTAAQKERQNG